MGDYALGVTSSIHFLLKFIFINEHKSKEVPFADNFTVAGDYSILEFIYRPLFGYFPKTSSHI